MLAPTECPSRDRDLWRRALVAVFVVGIIAGSVTGCAPDDASDDPNGDETGSSEDAILGGGVETGWPAVGMLRFKSGSFGTGTLISPTLILTAAHVAGGNPTAFFYGSPPAGKPPIPANLRSAAVAEVIIHPCYNTPKATGCPGDAIDVALVRLVKPITDVAPLKVIDSPLDYFWGLISPYEGDSCMAVGFGAYLTADHKVTAGSRRSAHSTIKSVDATELVTVRGTGIATSGDSGGPLVCAGKIIGTVRGSSGAVPTTSKFERIREGYERTDNVRDWIASGGKKR